MTGSLTSSLQNGEASGEHLENASEYDFGAESQLLRPPVLSEEDERKLWRKIDLRLMPILCVMYLMSFTDRGNIGNCAHNVLDEQLTSICVKGNVKPQPLTTQLNLRGNQSNITLMRNRTLLTVQGAKLCL
ncbi:hypothetical protein EV368DRAFT_86536 [Lentinula lateritia]|nr:hypothetical protein EV368DRAFT_86536 [Lentinula lateritia]